MTKEQLMAFGLTEEQATKVLKAHTETLDGSYVPKHRFDEVNGELKTSKEQLTDRDKQITDLKKFEGDTTALQDKIKTLEETNKASDTEHKVALALEQKKNAVKLALLEDEAGKPHDAEMVMGLFNLDQVSIDETSGKITAGFKEQVESIKKEKAFLFNVATPPKDDNKPFGWKPQGTPPSDGDKGGQGKDNAESYGKSLAQIKLGMMGVTPATTTK